MLRDVLMNYGHFQHFQVWAELGSDGRFTASRLLEQERNLHLLKKLCIDFREFSLSVLHEFLYLFFLNPDHCMFFFPSLNKLRNIILPPILPHSSQSPRSTFPLIIASEIDFLGLKAWLLFLSCAIYVIKKYLLILI